MDFAGVCVALEARLLLQRRRPGNEFYLDGRHSFGGPDPRFGGSDASQIQPRASHRKRESATPTLSTGSSMILFAPEQCTLFWMP